MIDRKNEVLEKGKFYIHLIDRLQFIAMNESFVSRNIAALSLADEIKANFEKEANRTLEQLTDEIQNAKLELGVIRNNNKNENIRNHN